MINLMASLPNMTFASNNPPAGNPPPADPTVPAPQRTTDDYCIIRKGVEGAAGFLGGLTSIAFNTLPSAVAGGIEGVDPDSANDIGEHECVLLVAQTTLAAGFAGAKLGGIMGGVIGAVSGLVGGIAYATMQDKGGAADAIGQAIKEKVDLAISDNEPTGSRTKDISKNFSEGLVTGTIAGAGSSFGLGRQEGAGVAAGLIEGTRGAAGVFFGKYDPVFEAANADAPKRGIISSILRVPRVLAQIAVGTTCGLTGAALSVLDGTMQGLGIGASHRYDGERSMHNFIQFTELMGAGTAIGATVGGGWLGGALGLAGGVVVATVVYRMQRKTHTDRVHVDYIANCVQRAAESNPTSAQPLYVAFRDGIQGGIVGGAAGTKAGFVVGYEGGKGVVDGVIDGVKGVAEGLIGAFRPRRPAPAPPQPPAQDPTAPPAEDPTQEPAPQA